MTLVLGLDMSLTSTGMAICESDKRITAHVNVKTAPKHGTNEIRINMINIALQVLLDSYRIKFAVIEDYAFSRPTNLSRLGEVGGVLKHTLYQQGVQFVVVSSTKIKKYATGFGDADKNLMLVQARKIEPGCPNHDVADAIHLARWGYANRQEIMNEHYDSKDHRLAGRSVSTTRRMRS